MIAAALGSGPDKIRSPADLIASGIHSAQAAALTTSLLIVGIIFAIGLADKYGRIRLQVFGFLGCAVGLVIATLSIDASGSMKVYLIMAGVMLFNFMTNVGPNAQTYLLAGEVFPTEVRGMGAGFAAMIGKVGAVATTFGFPILLATLGTRTLLYTLARHLGVGRGGDLDLPHRDDRGESRPDRARTAGAGGALMTKNLRRAIAGAARASASRSRRLRNLLRSLPRAAAYADGITLNETGSTLLYPLFKAWIAGYKSAAPDVELTAAGTGSGVGINSAIGGSVRIGASDAYLSDAVAAHNPEILNIPLAISAVAINYNLPGLNGANLKISGPALAAIYSGGITEWDDPKIKALNPGVALPHQGIIPVRRADRVGRHVRLHPIPGFLGRELGRQSGLWHRYLLAQGRRGENRTRQ